jgi:hypothetical protein
MHVWKCNNENTLIKNGEKRSNAGRVTIPDFELYYRGTVAKQRGTGTEVDTKSNGTE